MYRNKPNRLLFHFISRCSKLIVIKLCAISKMHAKVRRESVAGYATDETLVCGPKEHTRWWQRYRGHLQGLLYRLILNSYLSRCSKLIAIKLCAISEMHDKVRRESVAGYANDKTLVCGPKEHTRWWQRYRGHLQGLFYRLILNSYLSQLTYNIWVDRDIIHTNALAGTLLSFGIATLSGLMVKQLSLVF